MVLFLMQKQESLLQVQQLRWSMNLVGLLQKMKRLKLIVILVN
jgi:hypothetical protein